MSSFIKKELDPSAVVWCRWAFTSVRVRRGRRGSASPRYNPVWIQCQAPNGIEVQLIHHLHMGQLAAQKDAQIPLHLKELLLGHVLMHPQMSRCHCCFQSTFWKLLVASCCILSLNISCVVLSENSRSNHFPPSCKAELVRAFDLSGMGIVMMLHTAYHTLTPV